METNLLFAGLPINVIHQYELTRKLSKDYVTDLNPVIVLSVNSDDIEYEKKCLLLLHGENSIFSSLQDDYFEFIAVQRKISDLFPLYDRILFHGSALAIDGKGIIFSARSGVGKSTHAELWRKAFGERVTMVNDDKPFIWVGENNSVVYGSPWDGKYHFSSNVSFPLKAVCFLSRNETNQIKQVDGLDCFPNLFQQTYRSEDLFIFKKTLSLIDRLIKNTRLFDLRCNMEEEAAYVSYQGIMEVLNETE